MTHYSTLAIRQKKKYNKLIGRENRGQGTIEELVDSKDQLLYDLEMFVKATERHNRKKNRPTTKFYNLMHGSAFVPFYFEYVPSYSINNYTDRDFLELVNKVAEKSDGINGTYMIFVFNKDDIKSGKLNSNVFGVKDLPTLGKDKIIEIREKNPDDNEVFKFKSYDWFIVPQPSYTMMGFGLGRSSKLLRFYTLDTAFPAIVYNEKPEPGTGKIAYERMAIPNLFEQGVFVRRINLEFHSFLAETYAPSSEIYPYLYNKQDIILK